LERCYPTRAAGKFLKVGNVLEELKYRYDREVNNGHRSAIKKILEGNASPSLMMVLCISAIYSCPDLNNSKPEDDRAHTDDDNSENKSLRPAKRNMPTKIELTDGWYVVAFSVLHELKLKDVRTFSFSQVFSRCVIRSGTFGATREKKTFYRTEASGTVLFQLVMRHDYNLLIAPNMYFILADMGSFTMWVGWACVIS
jgi:hypothetical protein